jgi:ectoine hydroxylase-related dioxygenase (phytanoyl-CoA dioxygenase family)
MIAPLRKEQRPELSNTVVMSVEPGTLLLFPSWLVHFVEANTSAQTRVSVSFNVMFSSFAETISPTQWIPTLPLPLLP